MSGGLLPGPALSEGGPTLQEPSATERPRGGSSWQSPGHPTAGIGPREKASSRTGTFQARLSRSQHVPRRCAFSGLGAGEGAADKAGQGRATPTASESIITWWSFFAAKLGSSKSWASQEASGLTSPHLSQMRSQTTEKTLHFAGEQKTKHTRLHSSQH